MPLLEDLNRRGILVRTPAGHVPGPRAPREPAGSRMSHPALLLDDVTGIVLAGGRASRFGADKLMVELDGRPLLHHAIEAVAAVAREIIVVAAPGVEPPIPEGLGTASASSTTRSRSVARSSASLPRCSAVDTPLVLVVGGDMPRMVPAVLHRLAVTAGPDAPGSRASRSPVEFSRCRWQLDVHAARTAAAAVLERGGRSLRELLRELEASSIPAPAWLGLDPAGATIVDIDRPADFRS